MNLFIRYFGAAFAGGFWAAIVPHNKAAHAITGALCWLAGSFLARREFP